MQPCINEHRFVALEKTSTDMNRDIKALIKKLDSLIDVLVKVVYLAASCLISILGYLIVYWVKG